MSPIAGINYQDAVRALEKAGFRLVGQHSHVVLNSGQRHLTVPRGQPLLACTLGGIVRDAGLTADQFRKLL